MVINLIKNINIPVIGFGTYLIKDEDAQIIVHQAYT